MTRPTTLGRGLANQSSSGLGGSVTPPPAVDITYGGHVGTDVESALDGRPPTHVLASTDPTATDDDGDGHVVGCRWVNLAGAEEFVAVDVATGAAVWESTTAGGGGSLDVTDGTTTVSPTDTLDFDSVFFDVLSPGGDVAEVTFVGELDDIADVDTSGVADGDVLTYDSGGSEWIAATPSAGGGVTVQDEGTPLTTTATTLNFTGAGVTASGAGATKTIDIPGASGVGTWTLDLNQTGSSTTGWNSHGGGTWTSNGTEIVQTGTGGSWRIYRYGTELMVGWPFILECEAQVTAGAGGIQRVGIGTTDSTGGANGFNLNADIATNNMAFDKHNSATLISVGITFDPSIWYKLRIVSTSGGVTVYVDGTLRGSAFTLSQSAWNGGAFPCLYSYGVDALFRNIKGWTLSVGAPA
jgi:hypothetical protein